MKSIMAWLVVLITAAAVSLGFWPARAWLERGVRTRLADSSRQQIVMLPERAAARFVQQLAGGDSPLVDVLVAASADERPAVAAAAATALRELVERWSARPPEEYSLGVAQLAHTLAEQARTLPADRRLLAHSLMQRLIEWPIDGRIVDSAQFIDDCQAVLLLTRAEPAETRVAAIAPPPSIVSDASREPSATSAPGEPPTPDNPPAPTISGPEQQAPIMQPASPPQPGRPEPGPFKPAGAVRISDD